MKREILKVGDLFEGFDFLGSRDNGERLRETISKFLEDKIEVTLDFSGIDCISHSFSDEVFGLLYVRFGFDVIKSYLKITNAQSSITSMANFVIKERKKGFKGNGN